MTPLSYLGLMAALLSWSTQPSFVNQGQETISAASGLEELPMF